MAREARFAGVEASIGIVVLLIVWLVGVVGALGVIALFATGIVPPRPDYLAAAAGGLAVVGWYGYRIWRDFHLVRVVEITDDDHWILRSVFGVVRGRLAPDESRELRVLKAHVWQLVGVPRRSTQGWAEIIAGDRRWKTCRNPPDDLRPAVDLLKSWMQSHS